MNDKVECLTYGSDSSPFGVSFNAWTAKWWKWFHSFPKETNPAMDKTGEFCEASQRDPNVWFLVGTLGDSAIRSCKIPREKAILFPLITSAFSYAVDTNMVSEEELTNAAKEDIDKVVKLNLSLNDLVIEDFECYRVRSSPFADVINGNPTTAVSDGYWIFLKPLKVGQIKIYFVGQNIDFFNEVTYFLTIY